jgi:RecJ-like exonuclease
MLEMGRCICIAHSQDVDGIVSASILKAARGATPLLVDYPDLLRELMLIGDDVSELYICDLSISSSVAGEMKKLAKRMPVSYIDHHPMSDNLSVELARSGVRVIHSMDKCAGLLCYMVFEAKLPDWAAFLAAYASLSDYPSLSQEVSLFLERFDQKILAFEHSAFYYAIAMANNDLEFKLRVVDAISEGIPPHAVQGLMKYASDMVDYVFSIVKNANSKIAYGRNLGHIEVKGGASIIANALIHIIKTPVLLCYERNVKGRRYDMAIRGKGITCNLGTLASAAAIKIGGLGGGHQLAAGAQIPSDSLEVFIETLDDALNGMY